jgi:hypothetical protein
MILSSLHLEGLAVTNGPTTTPREITVLEASTLDKDSLVVSVLACMIRGATLMDLN